MNCQSKRPVSLPDTIEGSTPAGSVTAKHSSTGTPVPSKATSEPEPAVKATGLAVVPTHAVPAPIPAAVQAVEETPRYTEYRRAGLRSASPPVAPSSCTVAPKVLAVGPIRSATGAYTVVPGASVLKPVLNWKWTAEAST